jgi:hypothetical protein
MKMVFGMLASILIATSAPADDVQLQAGVARADITPASFMTMYGYANRKCGPANGTHDPLYAKALVLATFRRKIHYGENSGRSRAQERTLKTRKAPVERVHRGCKQGYWNGERTIQRVAAR